MVSRTEYYRQIGPSLSFFSSALSLSLLIYWIKRVRCSCCFSYIVLLLMKQIYISLTKDRLILVDELRVQLGEHVNVQSHFDVQWRLWGQRINDTDNNVDSSPKDPSQFCLAISPFWSSSASVHFLATYFKMPPSLSSRKVCVRLWEGWEKDDKARLTSNC